MSQEYIELSGSRAFELRRVDSILSELARPVLDEESIAPSTRAALLQIGICIAGDASRKDLVERLWGRKRSLRRQLSDLGAWAPMPPVA
jgi:hypothetical protein